MAAYQTTITRAPEASPENTHVPAGANEARSAVTGHKARFVLFASTVMVVLIFAGVYFYYFV